MPICLLLIATVGITIFANSLSGPFLFDDLASIPQNVSIQHMWPLPGALVTPHKGESVAGRPLVNVSLAADYALGGLDVGVYHVTNIALHIACALLLFGIVRRTVARVMANANEENTSTGIALSAALMWTIHPLQSESVDYVIARTESMMALFYLLTLYASIRAIDSTPRRGWISLAIFASALGMACKESMATVPLVVILYDRVFVFGSWKQAVQQRGFFYLMLAATWMPLVALTWNAPRAHSAGFGTGMDAGNPVNYLLNQTVMIARYLRLFVWPRGLVLDYGPPRILSVVDVRAQLALVALLLGLTIAGLFLWPRLGFLGAWFFITLAPTSSVIPIATEVGAERRMYLPAMALTVLVVVLADAARRRFLRHAGVVWAAALTTVCIALAIFTIQRNGEYQSELTMWRTVVERWPHGRARSNLAGYLQLADRRPEAVQQLRLAVLDFPDAHYDLGAQLFAMQDYASAVTELRAFLAARPGHSKTPEAQDLLGRALLSQHDYTAALDHYRAEVQVRPNNAASWTNQGIALMAVGQSLDAVESFRRSVQLDRSVASSHRNLAAAFLQLKEFSNAEHEAREAAALSPAEANTHDLLGLALVGLNRVQDSLNEFREAVRLNPADAEFRQHLDISTRVAVQGR